MIRFFPMDLGGQHCVVCHKELRIADLPHSLNGVPGRPVDFVCPEHCSWCASHGQQLQIEKAS